MSGIAPETLAGIIRTHFAEAFEGAQGEWTWFVNHGPGAGILGALDALTAEQASREPPGGGPTAAAHTEHLRWWLANVNGVTRGEAWNPDWSESWSVRAVNEEEWRELRGALKREYALVREALSESLLEQADSNTLTGLLAMTPHAAHHLGSLRQLRRAIGA